MPDNKDDKLLLASLEDRFRQCENKYYPINSDFLDLNQQSLAENSFHMRTSAYCFWGGYAGAERKVMIFLPEYIDVEAARQNYAETDPEADPLLLLRATPTARDAALSHRDYLGALMGLGVRRSKIGDIIVDKAGADIVILRELADYLLLNYLKVGRYALHTEILPVREIRYTQPVTEDKQLNVASLRLDTVSAGSFGCSRSRAVAAAASGLLFVNGRQIVKPDFLLDAGDTLVWRGKGRIDIVEIGNKTHKGRIWLMISRYV